MTCEQCTFCRSGGLLADLILGHKWLQSNGEPTPAEFLETLRMVSRVGCLGRRCPRPTHPNMPDSGLHSMGFGLSRDIALLENKAGVVGEPDPGTEKSCTRIAGQLDPMYLGVAANSGIGLDGTQRLGRLGV